MPCNETNMLADASTATVTRPIWSYLLEAVIEISTVDVSAYRDILRLHGNIVS